MDMLATAKSKKYPTSLETYVGTDKKVTVKTAQEIADMLKERLGEALTACEIREYKTGVSQFPAPHLLVTVTREKFLDLVDALGELDFPHFHVMSGNDDGETIRQISHFSLFRREGRGKEVTVTVTVHVPKSDLVIPASPTRNLCSCPMTGTVRSCPGAATRRARTARTRPTAHRSSVSLTRRSRDD